jgi:uncharacterized protein (DUF1501 family)
MGMQQLPRREFLTATAGLSLVALGPKVPWFLEASAQESQRLAGSERVLVVVQLGGGNDGLNTVVPFRDELYRKARPTLAIPENQLLKVNDHLGLHPSLKGLAGLWEAGHLSIVQGVGYPNPNRSHFESMDIWHTARCEAAGRSTGWLGRYLDGTANAGGERDARGIHVGGEVQPLALMATHTAAVSLRSADQLRFERGPEGEAWKKAWGLSANEGTVTGGSGDLLKFIRTVSLSAVATSERLEQAARRGGDSETVYPGTDFGGKLRTVARLIDSGLSTRVYYLTLDGFDTHSAQPAAHAGLLQQFSDAMAAFQRDLQARGHEQRVLTMAFSEFGRRVAENASQGTDHGAAAPLFVMGAAVRGGVVGEHPSLQDLDDGDLRHHTDFRRIYAAVLENWLGVASRPILDADFEPLQVWS